jgi:RNA exonuclease 1
MIHKNVVDTSIVFPHREGLPKRRALKNLAKDFLMRLIQVEGNENPTHCNQSIAKFPYFSVPLESGHDSKEDALACLDLMLLKAKEVAKSL